MEIDITDFVTGENPFDYAHSRLEGGPNAGPATWANAKDSVERIRMLDTPEKLEAMRAWARATGAWDDVAGMTDRELNALFIQLVSNDLREMGLDNCELEDFDWEECYERQAAGQISGHVFLCDIEGDASFGRVFYYLGEQPCQQSCASF